MFFTKAGFAIAWLLFVPGAIGYGLICAFVWSGNAGKAAEIFGERFVASTSSFGQAIALGVAFGIASEISTAIARRQTDTEGSKS